MIQPQNVYYLTPADHHEGTIIDTETFGASLKLDLNELDDDIKVLHNEKGELVIEK